MKHWLYLTIAIAAEVTATLSLRAATDHAAWYGVVAVAYVVSFAALAAVLRIGVAIGVVYAIWSAVGVALTAVLAAVIFSEPVTPLLGLGIVLVIGGVVLVATGSTGPADGEPSAATAETA